MTVNKKKLEQKRSDYIREELQYQPEEEINEIINIVSQNINDTDAYNILNKKLVEKLGLETVSFTKKILFFKAKPCKFGDSCEKIEKCVFIHDSDIEKVEANRKTEIVKNDSENIKYESEKKRQKIENKEVIINHIPSDLKEEEIKKHLENFGEIDNYSILTKTKHLVTFSNLKDAEKFINSPKEIGNFRVAKFFNGKLLQKEEDSFEVKILNSLRKHDKIIDSLFLEGNKEKAKELNDIRNEIKNIILNRK